MGVAALRGQRHMLNKNLPEYVSPPPRVDSSVASSLRGDWEEELPREKWSG